MVREATLRKKKYESKIDADVIRSRIEKLKDTMVSQVSDRYPELATIEANVKAVVEAITPAIPSMFLPAYLNVGRELYGLSRRFSGATFGLEAQVCLNKWYARGLNASALQGIAKLFGVTWTPPSP